MMGATHDNAGEQIKEMLQESMKQEMDCCLCRKHADVRSVFIPESGFSEKLGAPKGKTRVIVYPICESCAQDPFAKLKAEDWLLKQAAIGRN